MNPRAPGLNAVNAKNIVRRQTRLSSLRNAESAFMHHVQILVKKEVLDLGSDNGSWYCKDCKAECGLSSGAVLNDQKQFSVTCGFTMTALTSLIFSMKRCKIQVAPGFVQNVIFSTSQIHFFLSS